MTIKTAAIITAIALAGSAAAAVQVLDQGSSSSADASIIQVTGSNGAVLHFRVNGIPGSMHDRPAGVVYLTR